MSNVELEELVKVISLNPDSTNIIFINNRLVTMGDAFSLAEVLKKSHKADFGAICMVDGYPEDAVKLISAKDLETK